MNLGRMTSTLSSAYALGPNSFGSYGFGRFTHNKEYFLAQRSVRDLEANGHRAFHDVYNIERGEVIHSAEIGKQVAYEFSPRGHWSLTLQNVAGKDGGKAEKPVLRLEERGKNAVSGINIAIDASDEHGKVLGDSWFGGIAFSCDSEERFVAYTACSKQEVASKKSYFDTVDKEKKDDEHSLGTKFEFEDDWGERYVGVHSTAICVADTRTGRTRVVPGIKRGSTVGQPVWRAVEDRFILSYTKWTKGAAGGVAGQLSEEAESEEQGPWKLGMIYCYQRPCAVFSVDLTDWLLGGCKDDTLAKHECLTPRLTNARSPRFSTDGQVMVFIGRRERLASHNGCFALYAMTCTDNKVHLIQDLVQEPREEGFPGFFGDQLPRNCFVRPQGNEGKYAFVFNSMWRSSDTATLVRFTLDGAQGVRDVVVSALLYGAGDMLVPGQGAVVLDARGGRVLLQTSTPNSPQRLFIANLGEDESRPEIQPMPAQRPSHIHFKCGKVGGESQEAMYPAATAAALQDNLARMEWKLQQHKPSSATTDSDISFQSILLLPPGAIVTNKKIPLLLVPHGGPHSCMPTAFVPSYAYLSIALGAAVLHVNYRGSTGFGQRGIDSLCGSIGTNDVSDMMRALEDTLASHKDLIDPAKLCVVGGSHGGFLTGHLIGQHPDTFRAAALRNPVTNIPAMVGVTDIPDWCWVETLGADSDFDFHRHEPASSKVLDLMFLKSPVAHIDKVKTPSLLCIGAVDRRVPQSQGIEYHNLLKSRNVPTRMLIFPEDCHAIDKPCSEAEHFVAIAEWFEKYLSS